MAFLDDTGPNEEAISDPLWGSFWLVFDQMERLILCNTAWAVTLVPGLLALAAPAVPLAVKGVLALATFGLAAVGLGILALISARAVERETIFVEQARELIQAYAKASALHLAPLYGLLAALACLNFVVGFVHLVPLTVCCQLGMILALVCSTYWGPIFARHPTWNSQQIALTAWRLVLRHPGATLATWLVSTLLLVIGVASIAGVILIVPIMVLIVQTNRYQSFARTAPLHQA